METAVKLTDGKVNLRGNLTFREPAKKADYLLYISANNPIAVVEAKDNNHSVSYGLQQAMTYAQMLDLPFAYSSNGDGFAEHDFLTGTEREFGLNEFPTEEELLARLNQEACVTPVQEAIRSQPYYSSQKTYPPRYYQRIAVNRTVDAIARGQDRILLVMATGTGKTYTTFQIVYRLLQSGMVQISLMGVQVTSTQYGVGTVMGQDINKITVQFTDVQKTFILDKKFHARPRFEDDEAIVEAFTVYGRAQEQIKRLQRELEMLQK